MSRLIALLAVAAGTGVLVAADALGHTPGVTDPGTAAHTARAVLAAAVTIPACAGLVAQHRTRKDHDR